MISAFEKRLGWPRGYAVVALVALLGAIGVGAFGAWAGARGRGIFWDELGFDVGPAWLALALVIAAPFLARFVSDAAARKIGAFFQKRPFVLVGAGALLYVLLMLGAARRVPFTPDEAGAILQARAFAAGKLSPRVAPELVEWVMPRVVQDDLVLLSRRDGRYTAAYWPGYALLMAPFAFLGIEWACNPTITAISLWALWLLARRLCAREDEPPRGSARDDELSNIDSKRNHEPQNTDSTRDERVLASDSEFAAPSNNRRAASGEAAKSGEVLSDEGGVWAMVLALCSAQIALHGATYAAMPAHFLFDVLFCLFWLHGSRRGAFAAGLVGGFALVLHNPVAHFSFALPWIVWTARFRRAHLGPLLAGYALLLVPIGAGWSAHLGGFDRGHYPGDAGVRVATSGSRFAEVFARVSYAMRPPDALLLLARGAGVCKTIVWAAPAVAGLALLGWLQTRRERAANAPLRVHALGLLGASLACNFGIYLFARFDQGHGWGFRYLHQSWPALAVLGAAFLVRQNKHWKKTAMMACACGLLLLLPPRALVMSQTIGTVEIERPPAPKKAHSMTFIRENGNVWIENDPFLRSQQWNLRFDSTQSNEKLARRFLQNARRDASGRWGEQWSGARFLRAGS